MANLTAPRDTRERHPKRIEIAAGAAVQAGAMVAINEADGLAYPATAAAGYNVRGRAARGAATGEVVQIDAGCYNYDAEGTITVAAIGKTAYVVDDHTVTLTSGAAVAGIIFDVTAEGVWVNII